MTFITALVSICSNFVLCMFFVGDLFTVSPFLATYGMPLCYCDLLKCWQRGDKKGSDYGYFTVSMTSIETTLRQDTEAKLLRLK